MTVHDNHIGASSLGDVVQSLYVYMPDMLILVGIVESTTRHKLSARNLSDPLMEVNELYTPPQCSKRAEINSIYAQ